MTTMTMIRIALATIAAGVTAGVAFGRLRGAWLPVGMAASVALMLV